MGGRGHRWRPWGEVGFWAHSEGGDNLLADWIQVRGRRVKADSKVGGPGNGNSGAGMAWVGRAGEMGGLGCTQETRHLSHSRDPQVGGQVGT